MVKIIRLLEVATTIGLIVVVGDTFLVMVILTNNRRNKEREGMG